MNEVQDNQDEHDKTMSLLQPRSRGGRIAIEGFSFQDRYALIYLIDSLQKRPDFSRLALEKAEDVEARFDTEAGATYQMIQVKNHGVGTSDAKKIIRDFYKWDEQTPDTWTSFVIACRGLDGKLRTIHNSLKDYRRLSADRFHPEEVLAGTRAHVKDRIKNNADLEECEAEFIVERVYFQPDLNYHDVEWVESRALDLLQRTYTISHDTAQYVLLRLCKLLSEAIGGSITRQQVEEIIQHELERHASERGAEAPGKPFMQAPQRPSKYVERPNELKRLKEILLPVASGDPPPVSRAILHGVPAVGKSVLAAAFARDQDITDAFPHGVLWVTLGTQPDLPQRLADWGRALKDPSVEKGPYPDAQAGTSQLQTLLQDKACLLVVDDAWKEEHIEPFLVGGPRCLLLVTSRKANLLPDATPIPLDEMRQREALKLMANWAGDIKDTDLPIAARLADEVGHLPLALELLAARAQAPKGSWVKVEQRWKVYKLVAAQRGRRPKTKDESLQISLELSLNELDDDDKEPYLQLGIFPEDTPFPVSAAGALWGLEEMDAEDFLVDLAEQALLTPRVVDGEQRYTFHDVQRDFVVACLGESRRIEAHGALVDGYWGRCGRSWAALESDGYIHDHLARHMEEGKLHQKLYALIDKGWKDAQFARTGSHFAFAGDVDLAIAAAGAEEPVNWVQLVRGCLATVTLTNVQPGIVGTMAQIGQVDRALGYAALTRHTIDRYEAYRMIGEALLEQGEGNGAGDAFGKALDAAQEIGREDPKAEALRTLAPLLARLGDKERLGQILAAAGELDTTLAHEPVFSEVAKALATIGDQEDVRQALEAVAEIHRSTTPRLEALSAVVQAMVRLEDRAGLGQAATVAEGTDSKEKRAEALCIVAGAQAQLGMTEEALDLVEQALAVAGATGNDESRAEALSQVAMRLSQAKLREETALAARQTLAAVSEVWEEEYSARAIETVSQALAEVGDTDHLTATLSAAQELKDAYPRARALTAVGRAMFRVGMDEKAAEVASEALAATTSIGFEPFLRSSVFCRLALAMQHMGREEEAVEQARQAIAFAQAIFDEEERTRTLGRLAELLAPVDAKAASQAPNQIQEESADSWPTADAGREELAKAEKEQREGFRAHLLSGAALYLAWARDESGVREALTKIEELEDKGTRAQKLGFLAPILAEEQMPREAVRAAMQAWALVGQLEDEGKKAGVLSDATLALAQMGQTEDAASAARQALDIAEAAATGQALTKGEDDDDLYRIQEVLRKIAQAMALIDDREGLSRVLGIAQLLPDGEDKARTLTTAAEALIQIQRLDEAAQAVRGAVAAVDAMEPKFLTESLAAKLLPVLVQLGEQVGLRRLLQQAGDGQDKEMQHGPSRAAVLSQLALALAQAGMTEEFEEAARLALVSVNAVEDGKVGTYLQALSDLIPVLAQAEMVEEARGARELAVAKAERLDPEQRSKKLEVLALDLVQAGMEDEAKQAVELATVAAEEVEEEGDRINRLANLARDVAQVGMADEAEEIARRTLQAVAAVGDENAQVEHWSILAEIWARVAIVEGAERAAKLALAEAGACEDEIDLANLIPALARDSDGLQKAMAAMEKIEDGWSKTRACASVAQALVRAGVENEAAEAIELGLRSAEAAADRQEPERVQMLCEMSRALLQVGMSDRAGLMAWEALAIAAELGYGRNESRALGNAILAVGQVGDGELLEQAREIVEALPEDYWYDREAKAPVLGQLARAFVQVGMAEEATRAAKRALAVAGDTESESGQATALSSVALALIDAGMPDEATRATQGALAAIGGLDYESSRGEALYAVAPALARVGDTAGLDQVQAEAETLDKEEYKALALGGIVRALAITGDQAGLARTLATLKELGYRKVRIGRLCLVAQDLAKAGMEAEALGMTHEALEASKAFSDDRHKANSLRDVIRTFARMEHSAGLQEARAVADSIQDKMHKTEALSTLTWALEQIGEQEQASRCLQETLVEARMAGRPFLFEALGCGAETLAAVDRGQVLWEVSEEIHELDAWWGAN